MGEFLTGVKDKYPAQVLKGRIECEGNVISCCMKDMLLLDDTNFEKSDFITTDGLFYFSMLKKLRDKGFYSLDEVTILSNLSEGMVEQYRDRGGFETIQHQIDIINTQNFDTYCDTLYRENIILHLHEDGFNLLKEVQVGNKKIAPLKLFRKLTAEEVQDWLEARISGYGTGYSSKILEEEEIDFDDEFFDSCELGEENGVPITDAGLDINGEDMSCYPFLSRQIQGLRHGTLNAMAGYSSVGKSSWFIATIMALIEHGEKVLIISNEEDIKKFKIKFLVWLLYKHNRYYKLTKKKMTSGDIDSEDRKQLDEIKNYWKEKYKGKVKFIAIADANMNLVKKKIRENALRYGYSSFLYDTFKIDAADFGKNRTDLALIEDSRELHTLSMKYDLIGMVSIQLAESTRGKLFLDASVLSQSKQVKEILETLLMMRTVYSEELDPKNKLYCRPFRLIKSNDKWIEEEYPLDDNGVFRFCFIEKNRNGDNSSDNGICYVYSFNGNHAVFREVCQARPRHGQLA